MGVFKKSSAVLPKIDNTPTRMGRSFKNTEGRSFAFGKTKDVTLSIYYNIPAHKIPPGWTMGWANNSPKNLTMLSLRGYTFVSPHMLPEFAWNVQGEAGKSEYIIKGNQVLMKIRTQNFINMRETRYKNYLYNRQLEEMRANIRDVKEMYNVKGSQIMLMNVA